MTLLQKITPNLWFDNQAEEAVKFYTSVFKDSGTGKISRYGKEGFEIHGKPEGTVMTIEFQLEGQRFLALNGGPSFKFNEAVSFVIACETQEEIDYYWTRLSEGGDRQAQQCGWLKDKYGLSWQIIPGELGKMLSDEDSEVTDNIMKLLLQMKKPDLAALRNASKKELEPAE